VQRAVELVIAASVESVAIAFAGDRDRCRAGLAGEAGVGVEAFGTGGAADQCGGEGAATDVLE
jgi:hypothetical protein